MTEKIRRKPYSVVLLDEIEKAHPDIFNMLLQILDDGVLTDSQGRKVDFKNAVIIMTSNIGARFLTEQPIAFGFSQEQANSTYDARVRERVLNEMKSIFKPEFLNRVDDIIVFSKLTQSDIETIASNLIKGLQKRVIGMGMSVELSQSAIAAIAKAGFDPAYGARPLRRAIQSRLEDPLAEKILEGAFKAGDSIMVDYADGAFVMTSVSH